MTTPTGQISASDIISEMGLAAGTAFNLNGATERNFAGVSSGAISMSDYKNKFRTSVTSSSPSGSVGSYPGDTQTCTTSSTTASQVTGGAGTYTYSWSRVSGSGSANSPTSATTTFSSTGTIPSGTITNQSIFKCTISKSTGGSVGYAYVTASFQFFNDGTPPP